MSTITVSPAPAPARVSTKRPKNNIKQMEALKVHGFEIEVTHYRYANREFGASKPGEPLTFVEKLNNIYGPDHILNKRQERYATENLIEFSRGPSKEFAPRGGMTQVTLLKDGRGFTGHSVCSIYDNFSRREGVRRAAKRAYESVLNPTVAAPEFVSPI